MDEIQASTPASPADPSRAGAPDPGPETPAAARRKKKGFEWGFLSGAAVVFSLAIWLEVAVTLATGAQEGEGAGRWLWAGGFFLVCLPILALMVYRWPLVFAFFRSVKVGVVNLVFIGTGAILGVLFHQEDPNFPIPPDDGRSALENGRYKHYLDFRRAHAFFIYNVTHGWMFHSLPGTDPECRVDDEAIAGSMANLALRIPDLEARFGEEFAVGINTSSERGLYTRAENQEIAAFESQWDDFWWTFWTWSDRIDFLRVYKSNWYAAFWAILFCGVLSNTFRGGWRRLLRPGKWGFVMTHAGVLLIIVGGWMGRITEQRGILELHIGEASDRFNGYDRKIRTFGMGEPFAMRLDAFRADHFDVLEIIYASEGADGGLDYEYMLDRQPKVRVYAGQELAYDYDDAGEPALRIEVLDYVPQAEIRRELRPAGPEERGSFPLARVGARHAGGQVDREEILTPLLPRSFVDARTGVRLRYALAEDLEAARRLLLQTVKPRYGLLQPVLRGDSSISGVVDVQPGNEFTVEDLGRKYRIEIVQAVPIMRLGRGADGKLDHTPSALPPEREAPENPAVELRITGPEGESEQRWVLQEKFQHGPRTFPDLDFDFVWDDWGAPATSRWLLIQLPDGEDGGSRLVAGKIGDPGSLAAVEAGGEIPTDELHPLVVLEAYRRAAPEWEFEPVRGADFFHPAPAAARLRVTTPGEQGGEFIEREVVLRGESGSQGELFHYDGPDGRGRNVLLRFHPDMEDLPYEWRSRLTVLEPRGPHGDWAETEHTGEIRVNDYYYYDGYRFFQTNARPDDPTYSGIGVVYDPGISVVLAGLYLLAIGTIVVFLVKPILTRRHRGI